MGIMGPEYKFWTMNWLGRLEVTVTIFDSFYLNLVKLLSFISAVRRYTLLEMATLTH